MGDILTLAKKFERAMRNGTGFQITSDEVMAAVEDDVLDAIHAAKLRKIKQQCLGKMTATSSENIGSISGETVNRPTFGRSHDTPKNLGPSFIEALNVGA